MASVALALSVEGTHFSSLLITLSAFPQLKSRRAMLFCGQNFSHSFVAINKQFTSYNFTFIAYSNRMKRRQWRQLAAGSRQPGVKSTRLIRPQQLDCSPHEWGHGWGLGPGSSFFTSSVVSFVFRLHCVRNTVFLGYGVYMVDEDSSQQMYRYFQLISRTRPIAKKPWHQWIGIAWSEPILPPSSMFKSYSLCVFWTRS